MLVNRKTRLTRCLSQKEPLKESLSTFYEILDAPPSLYVVRLFQTTSILIDGTIRRTPVAEIFIETPFYSGPTTAVCMKNPIYDVIIGNIRGARDATNPQQTLQSTRAVQTKSHTQTSSGTIDKITPDQ